MQDHKIISVINYKGGVGRSTVTLNLAKALTLASKKILCIDLDPKSDLSQSSINSYEINFNLYDCFNNNNFSLVHIVKKSTHGFYLAPSGKNMDNLEYSLAKTDTFVPHRRLKYLIDDYDATYDYILIDTPPFPSIVNINAITASDILLVPITLDYNCLNAVSLLFNTLKNLNFNKKLFFIINKYDKREAIGDDIIKKFKEKYFNNFFLNTKIRIDCNYKILIEKQKTIFDLEPPRGKGFLDYTQLSTEFLYLIENDKDVFFENKSHNI